MEVLLILGWFVFWGVVCAIQAKKKGRNEIGWFVLGLLFSFFAFVVILVLPDSGAKTPLAEISDKYNEAIHEKRLLELKLAGETQSTTKTCPYCAETIKAEAIICRFCGRDMPVPVAESTAQNADS